MAHIDWRALLLPLVLLGGASCATTKRDASPEATLTAFADALDRGDLQRAYELLTEDARSAVGFERFAHELKQNPEDARQLARALRGHRRTQLYAQVELADGDTVRLERHGPRFQIATQLTDFYSQATPRAALDSFVRAVEHSRWDIVLALMPSADREGLDDATLGKHLEAQIEELTRLVALLKASGDAPIEVVGDRATMPYGESYTARLLREDGVWKIEDPE